MRIAFQPFMLKDVLCINSVGRGVFGVPLLGSHSARVCGNICSVVLPGIYHSIRE